MRFRKQRQTKSALKRIFGSQKRSETCRSLNVEPFEERIALSGEPILLADVNIGDASSAPREFVEIGDQALFAADDGVNGVELWITDGTTPGHSTRQGYIHGQSQRLSRQLLSRGTAQYQWDRVLFRG